MQPRQLECGEGQVQTLSRSPVLPIGELSLHPPRRACAPQAGLLRLRPLGYQLQRLRPSWSGAKLGVLAGVRERPQPLLTPVLGLLAAQERRVRAWVMGSA